MKDSKNRKGFVIALVLSLVANVVLLVGFYVIGQKSHFFRKMEIRLGWKEQVPRDRADYWCIRGWTNTLRKLNYDADVVFFGNSITCGSSFHKLFPQLNICNLGYSGDNMDGMMLRIGQIEAVTPEKIFVMAGINGLQVQTDKVFETKYQCMVDSIKSAMPEAEIYLQSILPVNHSMKKGVASAERIRRANEIIAEIAIRSNCVYVDLWSLYEKEGEMPKELTRDGVHLFPEAYDRWADEIERYIQ